MMDAREALKAVLGLARSSYEVANKIQRNDGSEAQWEAIRECLDLSEELYQTHGELIDALDDEYLASKEPYPQVASPVEASNPADRLQIVIGMAQLFLEVNERYAGVSGMYQTKLQQEEAIVKLTSFVSRYGAQLNEQLSSADIRPEM